MSLRPSQNVLALDLATRVGWCVGREFDTPRYGVWILGGVKQLGRSFSCLAQMLEAAIAVHQPDHLILEAPIPQQARDTQQVARLLVGLAAVAEMIGFEKGMEGRISEAFPSEARKLVLGTARVDKDDIIAWCRAQGYQPPDHNAADSLVLWKYRHILNRSRVMAGAGSV